MIARRLGSAALLAWSLADPVAAEPPAAAGRDSGGSLLARARTGGASRRVPAEWTFSTASQAGSQPSGPVFRRGGGWARAEASALVGSQLVNQDLGFSRNIFHTVSAEAEDVGFGEHYGARGAFFVNSYLGAEAGFTRTTTEFEFSVADEEAGVTIFEENLVQESREAAVAALAQLPLAAMTPYAVAGYSWRTSEAEGGAPFRAGAVVLGFGVKVPFPGMPVALAFDYRHVRYPADEADALRLAEGGAEGPTVSALTLGVILRLSVRR